uniref:GNAT family N-acetyltransferase n=1 Tax=Pararhizobium sp. IMCC3301 TaxID=3067904 RepID=UPI0027416CE9|nr:GNAT family N-acetyltransferase [Pararhizobium sp. IMCC3301]
MRTADSLPDYRPFRRSGKGVIFTHTDGTSVFVRGLGPADIRAYGAHLLRLSSEDRRARFNATLTDSGIQRHVDRLGWSETLLFGVYVDGVLRGAAEFIEIRKSRDCEIALSVETAYQHHAIGRILMATLLVCGSLLGLERMKLYFRNDNVQMRNLAREFGARMTPSPDFVEAEITTSRTEIVTA